MKSMRARLLFGLMTGAFLCCAMALGMLYLLADAEADQQADLRLRQLALSLTAASSQGAAWPADIGREENITVQWWQADHLVQAAGSDRALPLFARQGFGTATFGTQRWRSFSAAGHGGAIVQVAQPVSVRQRRAGRIALRIALPFAFLLPALGLLIWIVVGRALAPLSALAAAVAGAGAGASPWHAPSFESANTAPELEQIVAALKALLAQVDRSMRSQRDFVTDAAHELRSPLAALKLELQMAERSAGSQLVPAQTKTQFAGVRLRLDRATHMVNQLITLARHEGGSLEGGGRRKRRDLEQLARAGIAEHARDAEVRNLDLGLAADSAPASVMADADALMVALRNLIDNALRYTPPGGKVDVGAGIEKGRAFIRVSDNGPGIGADERLRVFDRFFRGEQAGKADGATPGAPGCGLGMSIVRSVAQLHGAQVLLADAPGGGLSATILFAPESSS